MMKATYFIFALTVACIITISSVSSVSATKPASSLLLRRRHRAPVSEPVTDLCELALNISGCAHFPTTTSDGFVLDVVRFPNKGGYPVFLQHGLEDSGITWFANASPFQNLANMLYNAGFDVFIGNSRGNHYSTLNVNYPSEGGDYFDLIDWDHMNRDTDAVIAQIRRVTGRRTLAYVGHSQGTTSFFAAMSSYKAGTASPNMIKEHETIRANIKDAVDVALLLAPVARVAHTTSLAVKLLADIDTAKWLALFGDKWFLETAAMDWLLQKLGVVCDVTPGLCDDLLMLLCGQDGGTKSINGTNIDRRILKADPGGTSVKNMRHWASAVRTDDFRMFDYGSAEENRKHYNVSTTPIYDLSTINAQTVPPLVLASGTNDALADPIDVQWLISTLGKGAMVKHIGPLVGYAHLDFVWGLNAHTILYPQLITEIQKYMKN